jgi:hypothetical protein
MDRYTVNTAKSQSGFIQNLVIPLYDLIKTMLPETAEALQNLEVNKKIWDGRVAEFDEKLSSSSSHWLSSK